MSTPTNEARPDTTNVPVPWAGKRRYFDLLLGASCVILIISNIAATKSIEFGPLPFEFPPFTNGNFIPSDGGFFLYPLAYVLGDVLSLRCTGLSALAGLLSPRLWRRRSLPGASC